MGTANCLCRRYNPAALIGELDSFFLYVLKPEMPTLCTTDFSDWSSARGSLSPQGSLPKQRR